MAATALVTGQLLTSVGPAVAQGPSPEPVGLAGRVEVPGLGFALSFPDDWIWVRYGPDLDELVDQLGAFATLEAAESRRAVLAELEPDFPLLGLPVLGPVRPVPHVCHIPTPARNAPESKGLTDLLGWPRTLQTGVGLSTATSPLPRGPRHGYSRAQNGRR